MTTARGWLDELTAYYTPSSTQFDGARSHRFAIEARRLAATRTTVRF